MGREEELERLEAFLREERPAPVALVVGGEAGIGKTTLWSAALERAHAAGFTVVRATPAEAERSLPYAGLGDLFEDLGEDVLERLPPPRAAALRWALLLAEKPSGRVDRRAIAVAVRTTLELLAEDAPVLVAIDDAQWLDRDTADALLFALRRLTGRVSVLVTRRRGATTGAGFPAGLADVRLLALGPLSLGALHRLLREQLGRPVARQPLVRIHEQSGGNPFYALELAPYLLAPGAPRTFRVPETLDQLLRTRISGLPAATLEALELLSALGPAPPELLARTGVAVESLDAAAAARVVELAGGTVRFAHPLLASLVYGDLGDRNRGLHARLAGVVDDPVARARHLALAAPDRDDGVADVVAAAAVVASERGAHATAADLYEHAIALTTARRADLQAQRTLLAARASQAAGDWEHARRLVERLLDEDRPGGHRAEALVLLAGLEPIHEQVELLSRALAEASERPALRGEIHCRLAWASRFAAGRGHARAARALADELGDRSLRARAEAVGSVLAWFMGGEPLPADPSRLHGEFAAAIGGFQLVHEATEAVANSCAPLDARERVRALFLAEHEQWREHDEPRAGHALWGLSWLEFWAGEWEQAALHAEEAHSIAIQYGLERPQDHLPLAVVQVHRGRLTDARLHAERALELALEQFGFHPPQHAAVVGLAYTWSGDPAAGISWLERAEQRAVELGWREPSVRWWTGDLVEALLAAGRAEEAVELIERWEQDALRVEREWVLPHAWRCRALVAAAGSDYGEAEALARRAVLEHRRLGDPYGRARSELALGVVLRRARQKRASREAIERALEAFEQLDALGWMDAARAELGRIGGRARQDGLTQVEQRVALLVAEGRTNREVAGILFLAERTVASHLTHIYAKLGVHSRTQLARKVQTF
ncbi:MAG TPA: AAA family ATPase [Gaiellaceae bacterium]|nr:AAA family ATPase [Gaiellaceae bacterium]